MKEQKQTYRLTEKYRPKLWEDFLGQENAVKYLKKLVKRIYDGKFNTESILIHGPFGTSKTSFARMLGSHIFCEDQNPENPCGICPNCICHNHNYSYREIDCPKVVSSDSVFNDFMDSFSVQIKIEGGGFNFNKNRISIFVLDEAQALKGNKMSRFLKLIEDAAKGTLLIFLTTDITSIDTAIQSRCTNILTHLLSVEDSIKLLEKICHNEAFEYEEEALKSIALKAMGHPRDIVKYLDQLYNFNERITQENAIKVLNLNPPTWISDILLKIFKGNPLNDIFDMVNEDVANPEDKHLLIKEFTMLVELKRGKSKAIINTEFNYLPAHFITDIFDEFNHVTKKLGISPHDAWENLMRFIHYSSVKTDTEWLFFLKELYDLVNKKKFDIENNQNKSNAFIPITSPCYAKRKIVYKKT